MYDNSDIVIIEDEIECVPIVSYYPNQYSDLYTDTRRIKREQPIWYDSRGVCQQLKSNGIHIKVTDFYDIVINEDLPLRVVLPREPNSTNYWADIKHPQYGIYALNEYHPRYGNHPEFSQSFIDAFMQQYPARCGELNTLLNSEIDWSDDIPTVILKLLQKKRFTYYQVYKSRLYLSYLRSERWKKIREKITSRDRSCQACGKKNVPLEVHHTTYRYCFMEDTDLNTLNTLISLCSTCHRRQHGKQ